MALYSLRAQVIKRADGRNSVQAAAYRSGTRLVDERTGEVFDFSRRKGVVSAEIIAPDNAPDWMLNRAELWNAVEKIEGKSNSQLAREMRIALPHELDAEQRKALLYGFVQEQFVAKGMIADIALHLPDEQGDCRNHHAHIMLTMRELMGDGFHPAKATATARAWNHKDALKGWREAWDDHVRQTFDRLGIALSPDFDHRSYAERGIDREPTQHMGPTATNMERNGQASRIGDENRATQARNDNRAEAAKVAGVVDLEIERLRRSDPRELARMTKDQKARHAREWADLKAANAARKADLAAKRPDIKGMAANYRDETRPNWSAFGKAQARARRDFHRDERTLGGIVNNALRAVASRQINNTDRGYLRAVLAHVLVSSKRESALHELQAREKAAFAASMKSSLDTRIQTAKADHNARVAKATTEARKAYTDLKARQDLERSKIRDAWKAHEAAKQLAAANKRPRGPEANLGPQHARGQRLAAQGQAQPGPRNYARPGTTPKPETRAPEWRPRKQENNPVKHEFDDARRKNPPAPAAPQPTQRIAVSAPSPQPTPQGAPPPAQHVAREVAKVDKAAAWAKTPQGKAVVDRQAPKAAPDRAAKDWSKTATPQQSPPAKDAKPRADWSKNAAPATPAQPAQAKDQSARADWSKTTDKGQSSRAWREYAKPRSKDRDYDRDR